MLGISGPEFFVIVLVAVIVIGPQRLPEYTRKLTQAVRRLRVFLDDAKEQIAEEVGPELADLNLADLNPRNYDPRKIVRDALGEDLDAIRKDLATPFQSVSKAAKEVSAEAEDVVRAGGKSRGEKKSLSRMIDDKVKETKEARGETTADAPADETSVATESAEGAAGTPAPGTAAEADKAGEAEKVEEAEKAGEETGTVEAVAEADAQDSEAGGTPVEGTAPETENAEAVENTEASDSSESTESSGPSGDIAEAAEETASEADAGIGAAGEDEESSAQQEPEAEDREPVQDEPKTEKTEERPAPVPSSLTDDGRAPSAPRRQLVSPRDIVRAANTAARTRAAAATMTVDV